MTRSEILDEAKKQVCGGRDEDYGQPENNFEFIGRLWATYLESSLGHPIDPIGPTDVAMLLALVKVARIASGTKSDSFTDLAGYAACAGEIATEGNNHGNL